MSSYDAFNVKLNHENDIFNSKGLNDKYNQYNLIKGDDAPAGGWFLNKARSRPPFLTISNVDPQMTWFV